MDNNTRSILIEMHKFLNKCLNQNENSGLYYNEDKNAITFGKLLSTK